MKHKAIPPGVIKKATRNFDANKLDYLQTELNKSGIPTIREHTIHSFNFQTKNQNRIPDLTVTSLNIIIEHDTQKVHGELGYENGKTVRRNADYTRANIPFVVINADLAKQFHLDESELAAYLVYHEKMKINAEEEV